LINSCGTERLGKGSPRDYQVRIRELNESEPLKRCPRIKCGAGREVGTTSQKLQGEA